MGKGEKKHEVNKRVSLPYSELYSIAELCHDMSYEKEEFENGRIRYSGRTDIPFSMKYKLGFNMDKVRPKILNYQNEYYYCRKKLDEKYKGILEVVDKEDQESIDRIQREKEETLMELNSKLSEEVYDVTLKTLDETEVNLYLNLVSEDFKEIEGESEEDKRTRFITVLDKYFGGLHKLVTLNHIMSNPSGLTIPEDVKKVLPFYMSGDDKVDAVLDFGEEGFTLDLVSSETKETDK